MSFLGRSREALLMRIFLVLIVHTQNRLVVLFVSYSLYVEYIQREFQLHAWLYNAMQNEADKDNEDRRSSTKEERGKRLIGQWLEVLAMMNGHKSSVTFHYRWKSRQFILIYKETYNSLFTFSVCLPSCSLQPRPNKSVPALPPLI